LEEAKYIGLTIGQDLKKKSHVNNVCTKTDKTLGFFRLNNISSTSVKEQAYKTLVGPSLEYSCSAWDSYNKIKAKLINSTRSNKGLQDMSPTDGETCLVFVTCEHLNWYSLEDRRKDARLVIMYKIAKENDGLETVMEHTLLVFHYLSL